MHEMSLALTSSMQNRAVVEHLGDNRGAHLAPRLVNVRRHEVVPLLVKPVGSLGLRREVLLVIDGHLRTWGGHTCCTYSRTQRLCIFALSSHRVGRVGIVFPCDTYSTRTRTKYQNRLLY